MPQIGTTFSQKQCHYLELNYTEALNNILTLPLTYVRVAAYWDEIEPVSGIFNFNVLDNIINLIMKSDKKIILAVGMKAPRWPEFHFPSWVKNKYNCELSKIPMDTQTELSDLAFQFIKQVVNRYKNIAAISHIQIENEAFNNFSFTKNRFLSFSYIRRSVNLCHVLCPDKKILLTNAISLSPFELNKSYQESFRQNISLADAVGINVYSCVPVGKTSYLRPTFLYWWQLSRWQKTMQKCGVERWVTEVQAEPWEFQSAVHTQKTVYPSCSPQSTKALIHKLSDTGFQVILLWGCEYWYWSKLHRREEWWNNILE